MLDAVLGDGKDNSWVTQSVDYGLSPMHASTDQALRQSQQSDDSNRQDLSYQQDGNTTLDVTAVEIE
jgi:hypothetical protein